MGGFDPQYWSPMAEKQDQAPAKSTTSDGSGTATTDLATTASSPYDNGSSPFSPPGRRQLPQSQSLQFCGSFISPASSGKNGCGTADTVFSMSPESSRLGTHTEPRNYAPRTSGLASMTTREPPPKFDLGHLGAKKLDAVAADDRTSYTDGRLQELQAKKNDEPCSVPTGLADC